MINEDDERMLHGIQQLLGKEDYDPPERLIVCNHVSDGYVYEITPLYKTLRCSKCGIHYDVPHDGT